MVSGEDRHGERWSVVETDMVRGGQWWTEVVSGAEDRHGERWSVVKTDMVRGGQW